MMRRSFNLFLSLVFILVSTVFAEADSQLYDKVYIKTLKGGFSESLPILLKKYSLSKEKFSIIIQKRSSDMTGSELFLVNSIREQQQRPTADTLMQKVISIESMKKYLAGEFVSFKGFISICSDISEYSTPSDFYYGLRLDYPGTVYSGNDASCGVIRFKALNAKYAVIPRTLDNGGLLKDPYPFGGAGFTTGFRGRTGTPEWYIKEFLILEDGAQIFEVFKDGTECLRGVYNARSGRFFPCESFLNKGRELKNGH